MADSTLGYSQATPDSPPTVTAEEHAAKLKREARPMSNKEKLSAYFTIAAAALGLISDGCKSLCCCNFWNDLTQVLIQIRITLWPWPMYASYRYWNLKKSPLTIWVLSGGIQRLVSCWLYVCCFDQSVKRSISWWVDIVTLTWHDKWVALTQYTGAVLGQFFVGLVCDRVGRKVALFATTAFIVLGAILATAAHASTPAGLFWFLTVAR